MTGVRWGFNSSRGPKGSLSPAHSARQGPNALHTIMIPLGTIWPILGRLSQNNPARDYDKNNLKIVADIS